MTDQQIRDRIVGALSASMMPMEVEAECVAFLDRCVKQITWHPTKELPPMKTETYVDQEEMRRARIENEAEGVFFPEDDPDAW